MLAKLMGDSAFAAMTKSYLDEYPSRHFSIMTVANGLVLFLSKVAGCNPVYLELARFELALTKTLATKDAVILTNQKLANILQQQGQGVSFQLHPVVQIFYADYNTIELFEALQADYKPTITLHQLKSKQAVLIWRYNHQAFYSVLTEQEETLIVKLKQGVNFADLCAAMLAYFSEQEAISWVSQQIQLCLSRHLFIDEA